MHRLTDKTHIRPLSIYFVLIWVFRVQAFDVKVLYIRSDVREAPGDPVIVTDHHSRNTGKRKAGYVKRTLSTSGRTVQSDLVPDGRHLRAEMRIITKDRLACGGTLA